MDKLQTIREACIKANPKKEWEEYFPDAGDHRGVAVDIPCRLAAVLLAIDEKFVEENSGNWGVEETQSKLVKLWNLRNDDLSQQSEETINFLYDLLTPNQ